MTRYWHHAHGRLALAPCRVMAIVNVTPDSFSDGGRWFDGEAGRAKLDAIVEHCAAWVERGATILDVGGESTRPGSTPPSRTEERARVVPVIEALRRKPSLAELAISVDTRHAEVAAAALAAGASIVNDVSGLADPKMAALVAETGAGLVIGHMRGEPATMQADIHFDDLLGEIAAELGASLERARHAGVPDERILVDPCIGFGKTGEQSAALVSSSGWLEARLGQPVLIGASRKRFLGQLSGGKPATERTLASVVAALRAAQMGAAVVRVHDVAETLEALAVASGLAGASARHVPAAG